MFSEGRRRRRRLERFITSSSSLFLSSRDWNFNRESFGQKHRLARFPYSTFINVFYRWRNVPNFVGTGGNKNA